MGAEKKSPPGAKAKPKSEAKGVAKEISKSAAKATMPAKPVADKKTITKALPKSAAKPTKLAKPVADEKAPAKATAKTATKEIKAKPVAAKAVDKVASKPAAKATKTVKPETSTKKDAKPASPKIASKVTGKTSAKPGIVKAEKKELAHDHTFPPEYLVLMQKDPHWMHAFWDVNDSRMKEVSRKGSKLVLRMYDVSSDLTVRSNKRRFKDIEVPPGARSWYLQNSSTGAIQVSLGSVDSRGVFQPILDSSQVAAFGPAGEELASADSRFFRASLGGVGVDGFGSSGLAIPGMTISSVSPSSWSVSSFTGSSETQLQQASAGRGKDFFLWVKTRLIVYGGTRPNALLQVRGQPFPLRSDGTFSLEMDLPDSTQIIPVFATDFEGDFPTTIVPIVVKRTE